MNQDSNLSRAANRSAICRDVVGLLREGRRIVIERQSARSPSSGWLQRSADALRRVAQQKELSDEQCSQVVELLRECRKILRANTLARQFEKPWMRQASEVLGLAAALKTIGGGS